MNPLSSWFEAHGGLVGLGVEVAKWSLVLFSILSLAIIVERVIALRRARALENARYSDTRDFLRSGQLFEGEAPCQNIAAAGWEHRAHPARMREAMERQTTLEIAALGFNLPILATAASTAPYIGLFGTVLGILAAFRQISQSGQTGAAVIAGGISEALTATALGLGVAIPAVLAYNYFSGRINALALDIETHAEDLASVLESAHGELAGRETQSPAIANPVAARDSQVASPAESASTASFTAVDQGRERAMHEFVARDTVANQMAAREARDREAHDRKALEAREGETFGREAERGISAPETSVREAAAREVAAREMAARAALDREVAARITVNGHTSGERPEVVSRRVVSRETITPEETARVIAGSLGTASAAPNRTQNPEVNGDATDPQGP